MKIVRPYAKILEPELLVNALSVIEAGARVSHRSEEDQKENSAERFIRAVVLGHGDWSVVEHAFARVEFYVDRGITHEIVRHRLFSYTQESTRFVNYSKKKKNKMPPSFIYPKPDVECPHCFSCGYNMLICKCGSSHKFLSGVCSRCNKTESDLTLGCFYVQKSDSVNHPSHYGGEDNPYEVIKVCEAWLTRDEFIGAMKFQIWKYTARAGKKNSESEDYAKAQWYSNYINEYMKRWPK